MKENEHNTLTELLKKGTHSARKLRRARILLLAHSEKQNKEIARILGTSVSSVYRIKRRYTEGGIDHALNENKRPDTFRKLTGSEEALLIATACSEPPLGRAKWTLQLLADKLIVLSDLSSISAKTIGRRLKENELKPWQKRMSCIAEVDGYFVANMEDILDLYAEKPDLKRPVISFDETSVQRIGDTRVPIPAKPGSTARYDYEYKRKGTANAFVFLNVNSPWRHVKITKRRTHADFEKCMRP